MTIEPVGDWLDLAPLRDRSVFLLYLHGADAHQAHTLPEKRVLLATFEEGGTVLIGWTGRWRTDVRHVDATARTELAECLA